MKSPIIVATLLLTAAFSKAADLAVPAALAGKTGPGRHAFRQQVLEKSDTGKDGKLSETERTAARQARKGKGREFRAKVLAHFDADKDGALSGAERETLKAAIKGRRQGRPGEGAKPGGPAAKMRQRLLERFDEDKDGQLSEAERAKAREARKSRTGV